MNTMRTRFWGEEPTALPLRERRLVLGRRYASNKLV